MSFPERPAAPVIWQPQPGPQEALIRCPHQEVLYGGARGGGKSDALIGDYASGIEEWGSAWKGIIVRKSFPQLREIESRCLEIFGPHYGFSSYKRGVKTWYFETAKGTAELRLHSCEDDVNIFKVQGHQFSWIGIDELTMFATDAVLEFLLTCLRSPKGAPTYVRLTANPGGPGHNWVKERFGIGIVPPMTPIEVTSKRGDTHYRVFIPAKVTDNKILMDNDPTYISRLDNIADPVMRRAHLLGDWNIAQGAAFPEWNPEIHVVDDHDVPRGSRIWRSCDWGRDKPYAVLWGYDDYDGNVVLCHELYGCGPKPNTGVGHSPSQVAERIREIEAARRWDVREAYLDPQCWAEMGGDSIFKLLGGHKMRWQKWAKGNDSRINHKQLVHEYLRVVNGDSRLKVMRHLVHFQRTISTIQLDKRDTEDVNTRGEDHLYDAFRGAMASRRAPLSVQEQIKTREQAWMREWDTDPAGQESRFGGW